MRLQRTIDEILASHPPKPDPAINLTGPQLEAAVTASRQRLTLALIALGREYGCDDTDAFPLIGAAMATLDRRHQQIRDDAVRGDTA